VEKTDLFNPTGLPFGKIFMGFFRHKALGGRLKPKQKKPPEGGYLNSFCSISPGVNAWASGKTTTILIDDPA